jgi:predicted AlkP superfamily pyrophosphatase or phosphodiesterase
LWKDQFKQSQGYRRRANTNVNNLNRTPYATVRTYALHQVEYIIVHQRHLIVLVNKINRNTTRSIEKSLFKIIMIKMIMKYYITGYSSKFVFQVLQSGYHIGCSSFCFIWKYRKNVV